MANQGISLHIGINRVDPAHYAGWDGQLAACEFDARDMQAIARRQGFASQLLLTSSATSLAVISAMAAAAKTLEQGGIFWLTYSGHGGQVPDINGDETDRQDETWVLFDRQLIDDELYRIWAKFKSGVRIMVLSDSCHSGTVVRELSVFLRANAGAPLPTRARFMPSDIARRTYLRHRELYRDIQRSMPEGETAKIKASVLLISGCQDNQTSADGDRNGLFTEKLRKVWANGKFSGGYRLLRDRIAALMPASQTPNYYRAGAVRPDFEAQLPFTL
jgi:metacaspase-1